MSNIHYSLFLSSTFIYEPILTKTSMNTYIKKAIFFYKMRYAIKAHICGNVKILKSSFSAIYILFVKSLIF